MEMGHFKSPLSLFSVAEFFLSSKLIVCRLGIAIRHLVFGDLEFIIWSLFIWSLSFALCDLFATSDYLCIT